MIFFLISDFPVCTNFLKLCDLGCVHIFNFTILLLSLSDNYPFRAVALLLKSYLFAMIVQFLLWNRFFFTDFIFFNFSLRKTVKKVKLWRPTGQTTGLRPPDGARNWRTQKEVSGKAQTNHRSYGCQTEKTTKLLVLLIYFVKYRRLKMYRIGR